MIHSLAEAMLLGAATACIVFVVAYHILADWRSSSVGRNVMAVMSVAAILLMLGLVREFIPWINEHIDVVRVFSYTAIAAVMWWRVVLLFQAKNRQDHEEEKKKENSR
jgi:predicted membrane protein